MTHYSIHSYASALRSFMRHLEDSGITEVTRIDKNAIRDYIRLIREERKLAISTIENHLSCISAFLDYLVYEEVIESNMALAVRKRYVRRYKAETPDGAQRRKLITTEQLKMLVDSILDVRDKAIVVLLSKTGIRRSELVTIDAGIMAIPYYGVIIQLTWSTVILLMSELVPNDLAVRVCSSPGSAITFYIAYFLGSGVPTAIAETAYNNAEAFMIEEAQERNAMRVPTIIILPEG